MEFNATMAEPTKAFLILNDLNTQGKLTDAVVCGVVKGTHKEYYFLYQEFKREMKSRFRTVTMAVYNVSFRMNVPQIKVWRAIRLMEG